MADAATSNSDPPTNSTPLGPILGSVVGGILFLLLSAWLGHRTYRRSRQRPKDSEPDDLWGKPELEGSHQQQQEAWPEDIPQLPHIELRGFECELNEVGELAPNEVVELEEEGTFELEAELPAELAGGGRLYPHSSVLDELEEKSTIREISEMK